LIPKQAKQPASHPEPLCVMGWKQQAFDQNDLFYQHHFKPKPMLSNALNNTQTFSILGHRKDFNR
jgi:hypothetical protein